jgi:hypothetical protein
MRKKWVALSLAAAAATAGVARANLMSEEIPADFVAQFAPFALQLLQAQFPDPPVKVEPLAEKTKGYHVQQQVAVVTMPDKNLTAKSIAECGEKAVPVAVCFTRALSVEGKDGVVNADKLAAADFNGMLKIPVFFLAVKGEGENRLLEVYSKDGTPLVVAPLKKQAGDDAAPVTVKLTNVDLEKKKADAAVSLPGGYETTLKMGQIDL